MGRIDREVIDAVAPSEGTVRLNHDDCPAGVDTKRRLYVTRKDNGIIVAYCHNCGSSGASIHRGINYRDRDATHNVRDATKEVIEMPLNVDYVVSRWPNKAWKWVAKADIPLTLIEECAIAYDKDTKRVIIPKWGVDNELVMYQSRNVGLDSGPKYITVRLKEAQVHMPIGNAGGTVVICEDMLSAIKLGLMVGVDAIPLFSSNVKIEKLLTPIENYGTIIVWLDNDSTEVERHANLLVREIRGLGKASTAITTHSDPKNFPCSTIQGVIIRAVGDAHV